MSRQSETIRRAIRDHISEKQGEATLDHAMILANHVRYDLLHGPAFTLMPQGNINLVTDDCLFSVYDDAQEEASRGDKIAETYAEPACALRDFIDNLPVTLYVDTDAGYATEYEPESQWSEMVTQEDEEGNEYEEEVWYDNDLSSWHECDRRDIIRALFGETIAKEFH